MQPNGPADKAGIKSGDVITALDGQLLTSSDQLVVLVRAHKVGDKIKLSIVRNGANLTKEVILGSARS